jgi:hypothetical protein
VPEAGSQAHCSAKGNEFSETLVIADYFVAWARQRDAGGAALAARRVPGDFAAFQGT